MARRLFWLGLLGLFGLVAVGWTEAGGTGGKAGQPKPGAPVSGIVLDKRDNWIKVKLDGKEEPATYIFDRADKKLLKAVDGIFTVARVRLTYKMTGDKQQLTSIVRTGTKNPNSPNNMGVMTGKVLATHQWWVEIKPKNGPPEGFAATYPKEHWDATIAKIKTLKKGDTVTIRYYTDFERHRIQAMTVQKTKK